MAKTSKTLAFEVDIVDVEQLPSGEARLLLRGSDDSVSELTASPETVKALKVGDRVTLKFIPIGKRGPAPKLSGEAVQRAIKKLGRDATARAVAKELRVSERTLERWRAKQGFTWQEVVDRAA